MSEQRKSPSYDPQRRQPDAEHNKAHAERQPEPAEWRDWRGEGVVGDRHTD